MTTKEILNISRKLLNLELICLKECNLMREKTFKDMHELLCFLEYDLDLNTEMLNFEQLLND